MPSTLEDVDDVEYSLKSSISKFCNNNGLSLPPATTVEVPDYFRHVLFSASEKGGRVLVTIDEYDRVARLAARQKVPSETACKLNRILDGMVGVLLDNHPLGHSLLMTGLISLFGRTDTTSSSRFDAVKNLTFDSHFATAVGFRKEDVRTELERIFNHILLEDEVALLLQRLQFSGGSSSSSSSSEEPTRQVLADACMFFYGVLVLWVPVRSQCAKGFQLHAVCEFFPNTHGRSISLYGLCLEQKNWTWALIPAFLTSIAG